VTAAAAVAGIAVTVPGASRPAGGGTAGFQRGPSLGVAASAAELVAYATRSAMSTPAFVPGPQNWTYFELYFGPNIAGPSATGTSQTWQQVGTTQFAATWQHGKLTHGTGGGPGAELGGWPGPNWTTMYQYLAALPAQPASLRKIILANNHGDPGAACTAIVNLLGNFVVTARFQAELYATLVSLPGVHFTRDAVDVDGRLGVGLYWVQGDQVVEIIVNPRTYVYMGTMSIAIKGHPSVDALLAHPSAAAIMDSAAILDSGIVSGAGQLPGGR
jgi:hypothetical protein